MIRKTITVIVYFCFINQLSAQLKTNLEIVHKLLLKSVDDISLQIPANVNKVSLSYVSPEQYKPLESRLTYYLKEKNLLSDNQKSNSVKLVYTLENTNVNYTDAFRDGFLGDYKLKREVQISGVFSFEKGENVIKSKVFNENYVDTVKFSDLKKIESPAFQFTNSEKPSEPLFESLWEPVIAVGTLIVSIVLLFTVRSK